MNERNKMEYFSGCLLGGAIGDALGWPVECASWDMISEKYGADGILMPEPGEGGLFEITDDTQMTLFTAEGVRSALIRSIGRTLRMSDFKKELWYSYISWWKTQALQTDEMDNRLGWLFRVEGLHRWRAPGTTCLSALSKDIFPKNGIADNNSKGCGGIMRVAPAALLAARICGGDRTLSAKMAFHIGSAAAALTHGHPSGYYSAGAQAAVIATIITGGTIEEGITISFALLENCNGASETITAMQSAIDLWRDSSQPSTPATVELLGGGWVGEEALAIGLYCALVAGNDFVRGVRLAVNHSGDSDSTGAITGNILGALLGEKAIPESWLARLELREVISQVATDLYRCVE